MKDMKDNMQCMMTLLADLRKCNTITSMQNSFWLLTDIYFIEMFMKLIKMKAEGERIRSYHMIVKQLTNEFKHIIT